MAKKDKAIDITKTGPQGYKQLQDINNIGSGDSDYDEFIKELNKKYAPTSLYDPIAHSEQLVNSPLSSTNIPWGESRYDENYATEEEFQHLGNVRAEAQPWYSKIGSGIAKGAILVGTTFLDGTIGAVVGIGTAIDEGRWSGLWDNDFSRAMQDINKASEEILPNYYSEAELNQPWYNNIFSANFIGDKFLKNIGFTVGAFYSGNVWAKGIQATKLPQFVGRVARNGAARELKAAKAAVAANEAGSAERLASAISRVGRATNAPAHVTSGIGAVASAVNEGRIEALNNTSDWAELETAKIEDYFSPLFKAVEDEYNANKGKEYEAINAADGRLTYKDKALTKYENDLAFLKQNYESAMAKLNEDRAKMGNADLLMNIPILVASNLIEFSRLYANGYKTARKASNIVNKGKYSNMSLKDALATARREGVSYEDFIKEFARFGTKEQKKGLAGFLTRTGRTMGKTAIPEGLEEIFQKAASVIAGDYYDSDIHSFYKAKTDPEASDETLNWMKAFAQGINETINDGSSWEEFFIGALTGALGMPVFGKSNTSAADTYLGKGKRVGLRGGIFGERLEQKEIANRENTIANYINSRIQSPEFKNYYQGIVRNKAFQNQMDEAALTGDELLFKNAEHKQLVSDIMMFDNAGKMGDLLTLINTAYDTSPENLKAIVRNTTAIVERGGKKELVGPFAEFATLDQSGTKVVDNFGDDTQMKVMADKLTKNRDEILKTIADYQTSKDELDILTGQKLSDDQLQELTWIKTQSKNWNERGKAIAKDRVRGVLSQLVGDTVQRRSSIREQKEKEGKTNVSRTELYDILSDLEKGQVTNQQVLDMLLGLNDETLFSVLGDNSQKTEALRKYFKKLAQLSPTVSPTDYENFKQGLDDMVKLFSGIKSFNSKLEEYLKNPETQAKELASVDAQQVQKEQANKVSSLVKRFNFNDKVSEIARVLEENKDEIESLGGIDEFVKTLPVEQRQKIKNAQRFQKGVNSLKDSVSSSDLTDEQKRIANSLIDNSIAKSNNIKEIADKISKSLDDNIVKSEILKTLNAREANDDIMVQSKVIETEAVLKDFFEKEIKKVADAISASEKTDSEALRKAAERVSKKEGEPTVDEVPSESSEAINTKTLGAKSLAKLKSNFKELPKDNKGKEGAQQVFQALNNPNLYSTGKGSTKNRRAAVNKLIRLVNKYPELSISKAILNELNSNEPTESEIEKRDIIEEKDLNASTTSIDLKKNYNFASPQAGIGGPAYFTRPQISQYRIGSRDGLTYIAYLEAALQDPQNYKDAFPKGVDKNKYLKYVKAVWNYLNDHNAFDYVSGLNPENKLKVGDKITFKVDEKLNEDAGVKVVLITTVDSNGNEQVVGSLPTSIDFSAINRQHNKREGDVRPGQQMLYENVLIGNIPETTVKSLLGGMIAFGNTESTVSEIFGDEAPVIAVLAEENSVLTTKDSTLDEKLISPGGIKSNAVTWGVYAMVPTNNGKYLPALCYSTKIADIIDDPSDWYVQQIVDAFKKLPERISELKDNIASIYRLMVIPGLSISIGRRTANGNWVKETENIGNATLIRITYTHPNHKEGRPMEKYLRIEDGEVSASEIREKVKEITETYPNLTTNVDIRRLTNKPEDQEYRKNISKYLHTNIMRGHPHSINDFFTYNPTEFETNVELEKNKKAPKEVVDRGPVTATITLNGKTYTVRGTFVEDANGAEVTPDEAHEVLKALATPSGSTPVEVPKPRSSDNPLFMALNMGMGEDLPQAGFAEEEYRKKHRRSKKLAVSETNEEAASQEVIYKNIEKVKAMFPQLGDSGRIIVVNGLIKTVDEKGNPIEAYGEFRDGILYLSDKSPVGTAYHEAFHYVVDMLLDNSGIQTMFEEARKRYGDLEDIALEEKLAEDFRHFMNGFDDKSLVGRLKNMFANLKHIIRSLVGRTTYLDNLFFDIYKHKFNHAKEGKAIKGDNPLLEFITKDSTDEKVIKGELGVNKSQLISLLGSTMYKANVQEVAVKELIQNAFDALKIAQSQGKVKDPTIKVTLDQSERTVQVQDNGTGMSPEIVQKAFFTIGGSYKGEGVDNRLKSGGLGLAKMAFLFSSEYVNVSTVKDGIKTEVHATPDQIQNDNFELITSKTSEPNGTSVIVKVPETYIDENGNERNIWFDNNVSFLNKPMIGNVSLVVENKGGYFNNGVKTYDKSKIPDRYSYIGKATSDFGDIEVYITPKSGESRYTDASILISGLYQFNHSIYNEGGASVNVILNILPSVGVQSQVYPINNQREGFRATVEPEIKDIEFLIKRINAVATKKTIAAAFKNSVSMDVSKVSEVKRESYSHEDIIKDSVQEVMKEISRSSETTMDNSISLSSIRTARKEAEEKKRRSSLNTSGIKIDDSEISVVDTSNLDVTKPLFHNNTTMKIEDDGKKVLDEIGTLMMELKSLYTQTYENAEIKTRFGVSSTEYIKDQFWGVSFDKNYGGVNVSPKVIKMLAINPFYRVKDYKGVDPSRMLMEYITHLIIHEFNHNYVSGEGPDFTGRFPETYAEFAGIGTEFDEWKNKLYNLIKNNIDVFVKYNKEYEQAANLGDSFKENRISRRTEGENRSLNGNGQELSWNRRSENVQQNGRKSEQIEQFERDLVKYQDEKLNYNNLDTDVKDALRAKNISKEDYEELNNDDKDSITFCLI